MDTAKTFDTFAHLERLLADFPRLRDAAREMRTPNSEDDEFIRCGILGFTRHLPAERWGYRHFQYVQKYRDEVSGGNYASDWVRFACLAAGYFVALAEAQVINEVDLRLSEAQTPGFMWLKCEAFGGAPRTADG